MTTMTWFIVLMFWSGSGEPHFKPGWEPYEIKHSECQVAGKALIDPAKEMVDIQGRYHIACIGAYSPEQMIELMVEGFNIKKGLPL